MDYWLISFTSVEETLRGRIYLERQGLIKDSQYRFVHRSSCPTNSGDRGLTTARNKTQFP